MSEKYSRREQRSSTKILVFDTSAFLAKYHLYVPSHGYTIYTPPTVIEEVRDMENKEALVLGLELSRITVRSPSQAYRERIMKKAKKKKLSDTDIDVVALALELREEGHEVTVLTDDYALQELLLENKINVKPLRTRGIKELSSYDFFSRTAIK